MRLPRLQIFEFEDLPWFPRTIRNLATDYLHFLQTRFNLHGQAAAVLRRALEETRTTVVVDLCSGAGGPLLAVYEELLNIGFSAPFVLTDRYPNIDAFRRLVNLHPSAISYSATSIDATAVPRHLPGFRTMFNAFHHFAPASARTVLTCAVEARQPIAVFELPDRAISAMIPLMLTPLFVAAATPFIRPFRWKRILWTYVVPLVPFMAWWDGMVSQFRAYTAEEMLGLTGGLDEFAWTADRVRIGGSLAHLTYLVGTPKAKSP